ncbi:RAB11-binding protein RELCH-like [Diaphorina citri]|uniref:RAB11-binding protein RELCH-like n=1 Tax=Diaphorina citri TaxID=121845 RepID=A0A3Q0IUR1_DIACI|nr:RAB11-binding protein RELCH-like [Diaphorina citri]
MSTQISVRGDSTSGKLSYSDIAAQLLEDKLLLTALELYFELLEVGKDIPKLREFFSNPGNFEQQSASRLEYLSSIPRSSSQATLDSLDFTRYSEDGERGVDERVAILEFELRKAKETISSLRANLTDATTEVEESSDHGQKSFPPCDPIKPHEKRCLNFLINEYLLHHNYKLTSITFADENEDQDFDDWDDVGLNTAKPAELVQLYRDGLRSSGNGGVNTCERCCQTDEESNLLVEELAEMSGKISSLELEKSELKTEIILVAEICAAFGPHVRPAARAMYVLPILQQLLLQDRDALVRASVVKSLALTVPFVDDVDKYVQCEELLMTGLSDVSRDVVEMTSQLLLPVMAKWSLDLRRLQSHFLVKLMQLISSQVKEILNESWYHFLVKLMQLISSQVKLEVPCTDLVPGQLETLRGMIKEAESRAGHRPVPSTPVQRYMDVQEELQSLLKHFMFSLALCGAPIDSLSYTIRELSRFSQYQDAVVAALWEGPDIGRSLPHRYKGSLLLNQTKKEIQDKTYFQFQTFLGDETLLENHAAQICLIGTLGKIAPCSLAWFREDAIAPQLCSWASSLCLLQSSTRKQDVLLALLDAFSNVLYTSLSPNTITTYMLPGLRGAPSVSLNLRMSLVISMRKESSSPLFQSSNTADISSWDIPVGEENTRLKSYNLVHLRKDIKDRGVDWMDVENNERYRYKICHSSSSIFRNFPEAFQKEILSRCYVRATHVHPLCLELDSSEGHLTPPMFLDLVTKTVIHQSQNDDLFPLLLATILLHSDPAQRETLIQVLFNTKKRPNEAERKIIVAGLHSILKHSPDLETTEAELLAPLWELLGSKYLDRRLLVAEICAAFGPHVRPAARAMYVLPILQQLLLQDRDALVRASVVKSLALTVTFVDDVDKYVQCEELLMTGLSDVSRDVVEMTSGPTSRNVRLSLDVGGDDCTARLSLDVGGDDHSSLNDNDWTRVSYVTTHTPDTRDDVISNALCHSLPQLLDIAESVSVSHHPTLVSYIITLIRSFCAGFGPHLTQALVRPLFLERIDRLEKSLANVRTEWTSMILLPVYVLGVLVELTDVQEELQSLLKHFMFSLALCGAPIDSLSYTIRELSRFSQYQDTVVAALWEGVVHARPVVRVVTAQLILETIPQVSDSLLTIKIVPALVTLSSDPDVSVKTATVPVFGSLLLNQTKKEIQDKTYFQFQTFLGDETLLENHAAQICLIGTLGKIAPCSLAWFREDGLTVKNPVSPKPSRTLLFDRKKLGFPA